jgi:threonine synthase
LQAAVGMRFYFKNDGQNPSASFKDRGMASAFSYINSIERPGFEVLAVCASTGDTSAAAALYAAYLQPRGQVRRLLPTKRSRPSSSPSPWAAAPGS